MNKNLKKMKNNWYVESQKRHEREKNLFYLLVFIAVIMFFFVLYLLIEF